MSVFSNILTIAEEEQIDPKLMGDPAKVIQYMDYQANPVPHNSRYIPDLVPGVLQPLELLDEDTEMDKLLSEVDIEKIVREAEEATRTHSDTLAKAHWRFGTSVSKDELQDFSHRM